MATLSASGGCILNEDKLTISWDAIEGADRYWIKKIDAQGNILQAYGYTAGTAITLAVDPAVEAYYGIIARIIVNGKATYTNVMPIAQYTPEE